MIVFLGVMAIKGLSGAAIDGITFKTAKYTIDKMVPVIGGMFSDSLDTLMACGLMVKNGVGIVGGGDHGCAMAAPIAAVVGNMFCLVGCRGFRSRLRMNDARQCLRELQGLCS